MSIKNRKSSISVQTKIELGYLHKNRRIARGMPA
ncbi:hypothetical protein Galf_0334 [Gallionella capsiferriformans ES-2]|uniref:Uncharacterized protein n=1 Tax=Gallionella capsiferriformans (strain ES-2) TaxID=395494 RepID=D9SJM9_GALCS|nr:hypothetical protein Galf_0334 [Gallionella capsiferriformans ES-2]